MKGSFRRRVAMAAAMLVGFYVLAGVVAAGLLGLVIAMWTTDVPQNIWISLACVVSGLAIVRGLIPERRGKFTDPGPRLDPADQPELHALVREVAEVTDQAPPADVYLAPDVNAAVMDTGGLFGSGGRRVMIVGLPLLEVLTVGQLRSVLAHEFGHYYGGDTRLGPWFFRTYDAIARTVTNLEAADSMWQKPFEWYGLFFLRRSSAIKRQQEFMADELSAKAAGKEAAIGSLHAVHAAAPAFDGYWESEVAPVLSSGARAPLLAGFRSFQSSDEVRTAMEKGVQAELEERDGDPYSTHPSLGERVVALEALPDGERASHPGDEEPALSLIREPERLEHDLLVALFGDEVATLEPISWDQVPQRVIVPGWREHMETYRPALAGITAAGMPDVAATGLEPFGRQLPLPPGIPADEGPFPSDLYVDVACAALDIGLGTALLDAGWEVSAPVGEPIVLTRGRHRIKPIGTAAALASGDLSREEWGLICEKTGIAGLQLGGAPAAAPPAPTPTGPPVPAAS